LRSISKPDTYSLNATATAQGGDVINISPSPIEIEVDTLAKRSVPIVVVKSGALPTGYWAAEPVLSAQSLAVQGAAADVGRVVRAVCNINLDGRNTGYNEAMELTLVDEAGETVDATLFVNTLPSVMVRMEVLQTATVPIDAASAIVGADALKADFEMVAAVPTPATVKIAGSIDALKAITSIPLESVDITAMSESLMQTVALRIPEGVTLVDTGDVNLYVDIREKIEERLYEDFPIEVDGLKRGHNATLAPKACSLTVAGRVSLLRALTRGDIRLYVDVAGLEAGTQELPVEIDLSAAGETAAAEISCLLSVDTVGVTILE
jgi:YbbR domain-containing protein